MKGNKKLGTILVMTALLIGIAVVFFNRRPDSDRKVFIYAAPLKADSGWGYKICRAGLHGVDTSKDKIFIKQEFIPAISGYHRFTSSADAMRVGNLVVYKLSSGASPSISLEELDSLGIAR